MLTKNPLLSMVMILNSAQKQALDVLDGPVLILAGAGTGKTRVLTYRVVRLIDEGYCQSDEILAVTFTNKAAEEMKKRIISLCPQYHPLPWIGTFHKIALNILKTHAKNMSIFGFSKEQFIIFDQNDTNNLIKTLLKEVGLSIYANNMRCAIDKLKNNGYLPNSNITQLQIPQYVLDFYKLYQDRLTSLNVLDFGDILLYTLRLLESNLDLLEYYGKKFRYILVDEYQDTNTVQYLLLKILAKQKNICCVGDEDQSIYGWRGARISNILSFERDFLGSRIIRLEQNYRSTGHILETASKLISYNRSRFGKTLWTADNLGDPVHVFSVLDQDAEAECIASILRNSNTSYTSAVLVRMSAQTRAIEESFLRNNIAYKIIGSTKFYDRLEVRDLISYLRFIAYPDHDFAFLRIINKPARGIGKKTLAYIAHYAEKYSISQFQSAHHIINQKILKSIAHKSLKRAIDLFDQLIALRKKINPLELAEQILKETQLLKCYQNRASEDRSRIENINELLYVIGNFDSLESFLEHVSLTLEVEINSDNHYVSIMTMHAAKGLEFDIVFLPGWEDGIFPSQRALESSLHALEEERRLAYVSLTRAKKKVFILNTMNRFLYGKWKCTIPSRFLRELPKGSVIFSQKEDYH